MRQTENRLTIVVTDTSDENTFIDIIQTLLKFAYNCDKNVEYIASEIKKPQNYGDSNNQAS
jgi:hypothetical protein